MKLPSPGFLFAAFSDACRRFPAAMLCAVAGVAVLFLLIDRASWGEAGLERTWMVCQLGLPLFTGLVALAESAAWDEKRKWLLQGAGLIALAVYWFVLEPKSETFEYVGLPRFMVLLLTAHLFTAVAPYLNKRPVADFWEYNRELFANLVIGAVFTLIMFAGLALAVLAVDQLFDLHIRSERIYSKLFVLLAGVFNTTYFLFHFPRKYEFSEADAGYHAVFKNLCKYILIPIVGIYFFILYTYGGKIIISWSLPRGWVSSLVLGFSVAGIFTYLLNFYLPEHDDSAWVRAFKRWFWWVQLPLTALLFVAIARRIGDYGVTEMRFLVAHLGVWLALTCLYFLFSKHDNIKYIPISLGLFALAFAFGPLNAFKVAERSQVGMLEKLLEKTGRLENGRLKQSTTTVETDDINNIQSALRFLEQRNALRRMTWLPMPLESFPSFNGARDATRVAIWAGIQAQKPVWENEYLPVRSTKEPFEGIDTKGFSAFYKIGLGVPGEKRSGYFFNLSDDGQHLDWKQAKSGRISTVESFDLNPVIRKWLALKKDDDQELMLEENYFDLNGRKANLRIFLVEAVIHQADPEKKLQSFNSYVFLKEK